MIDFSAEHWGASNGNTMVVSPPPEESLRRIRAGEMPFTSRRICTVEPSHYLPREDAEAVTRFIGLSPEMYRVCLLLDSLDCCEGYAFPDADWPKFWDALGRAREVLKQVPREAR